MNSCFVCSTAFGAHEVCAECGLCEKLSDNDYDYGDDDDDDLYYND